MSANTLDSRRFFRLDMPLHCWVMPRNRIPNCDVYATPAKYVTEQRLSYAKYKQDQAKVWLDKVTDQTDLAKVLYHDISKRLEFFSHIMQSVEQGKAPFKLDDYQKNLTMSKAENEHLEAYKVNSPKTYAFFKAIENKIKLYLNEIHYMAHNSDSRDLRYKHLLFSTPTQADLNLKTLSQPKFGDLPLPNFIRCLTEYVNITLDSFSEFQKDVVFKRFPSQWSETTVNLSEGGVRLVQSKMLRAGELVCVAFYNQDTPSIMALKGTVVGSHPVADSDGYQTRINFDFPDRAQQMMIQQVMNLHEVRLCESWINQEANQHVG